MIENIIAQYPFGKLNEKQTQGLNFLINKLKSSPIQSLRQQAYVLATIKHETAETYQPIKELGSSQYLQSKKYYPFIGRGYVQITWESNYKRFGELLRIDLVEKPDLALRPEISWVIAELGMTKGLFTGKRLSDYFNENKTDFVNARRIINGLDKAEKIAGDAESIYKIISGYKVIEFDEIPPAKDLHKDSA